MSSWGFQAVPETSPIPLSVQGWAPDQPGSDNLYTFDAAFSHHATYMFNMVSELFSHWQFVGEHSKSITPQDFLSLWRLPLQILSLR